MKEMMPIATLMPALLEQLGLAETAQGWRAVSDWPAIAGARIARHTRALSFRDGALTVEVEGSAWMHELGFLKPDLVRNLNRHLGVDVVRDVRFTPAGTRPRDGSGGSLR
jgi:predicted nucleic acid-binding Zn ribbon protein